MQEKKNQLPDPQQQNRTERDDKATGNKVQDDNTAKAHDQAEKDISNDAELSAHSPNDDLDEGETARLGDGDNPLI